MRESSLPLNKQAICNSKDCERTIPHLTTYRAGFAGRAWGPLIIIKKKHKKKQINALKNNRINVNIILHIDHPKNVMYLRGGCKKE